MCGSHISPRFTEGPNNSQEGGTIRYKWTESPWEEKSPKNYRACNRAYHVIQSFYITFQSLEVQWCPWFLSVSHKQFSQDLQSTMGLEGWSSCPMLHTQVRNRNTIDDPMWICQFSLLDDVPLLYRKYIAFFWIPSISTEVTPMF